MIEQMSMFSLMAAPLDMTPLSVDPCDRTLHDHWDELVARANAAERSGKIELLKFGDPRSYQAPHFTLELFCDDGGWRHSDRYALGTCGGAAPWSMERYRTRNAAILANLRKHLVNMASLTVRDEQSASKHIQQLLAWMIATFPQSDMGGADLGSEFDRACREAKDRWERHMAAARAAFDLKDRVDAVITELGCWAFEGGNTTGLIHDRSVAGWASNREEHAKAFPARWSICGIAPGALEVRFYPSEGQAENPLIQRAARAVQEQLSVPVTLTGEDWAYPLATWEQGDGESRNRDRTDNSHV